MINVFDTNNIAIYVESFDMSIFDIDFAYFLPFKNSILLRCCAQFHWVGLSVFNCVSFFNHADKILSKIGEGVFSAGIGKYFLVCCFHLLAIA